MVLKLTEHVRNIISPSISEKPWPGESLVYRIVFTIKSLGLYFTKKNP